MPTSYLGYRGALDQTCLLNEADSPLCGAFLSVKTLLLFPVPWGKEYFKTHKMMFNFNRKLYISKMFASNWIFTSSKISDAVHFSDRQKCKFQQRTLSYFSNSLIVQLQVETRLELTLFWYNTVPALICKSCSSDSWMLAGNFP